MKLLENKGFMQKITIILVIFLLTNFIMPNYSEAKANVNLISPVLTFVLWLGDGCIEIMQDVFMNEEAVITDYADYVESLGDGGSWWEKALSKNAAFWTKTTSFIPLIGESYQWTQENIDELINGDSGYDGPIVLVKYSVASIVSNCVPAFDVNFFNPQQINTTITEMVKLEEDTIKSLEEELKNDNMSEEEKEKCKKEIEIHKSGLKDLKEKTKVETSASILQKTISKWYSSLRNLAVVALLSILVYMGIKIILSSSSEEKAKYKSNIINWVTALVILFSLHYIMSIAMYLIDLLVKAISVSVLEENGMDPLIAIIRTNAEMGDGWKERLGYTVMYIVLIVYTLMFTFMYLKRVVFMAFLTIIAPLVAVTYPIDKEKDGKSQAFDFWIKEYFFNLIMQPIHLLLYYIYISSAIDLAKTNLIYALVAIGFIIPAEKLIRKMFNIEKAGNDSAIGAAGFTEGAIIASAFGGLQKLISGRGKGTQNGKSDDSDSEDSGIRTTDPFELDSQNVGNTLLERGINSEEEHPYGNRPYSDDEWNDIMDEVYSQQQNSQNSNEEHSYRGRQYSNGERNNVLDEVYSHQQNNINMNDNSRNKIENNINASGAGRQVQKPRNVDIILDSDPVNSVGKSKNNTPKFIKGVAAVGRKKFNGKAIVRALGATAKGVAHIGLGAAGATIGAAAAIASGDTRNFDNFVVKGVGAGVGIASLGTAAVQGTVNLGRSAKKEVTDISDTYKIAANNWTAQQYQDNVLIPREKKKNDKDKDVQEKYRMEFGDTKMMKSMVRDEMYKYGVINEDLIIKGIKEKNKNPNVSDKVLVKDAQYASYVKNYKDLETVEKRIIKDLEAQGVFDNLEKRLEKKGEFDGLDKKLEKKYQKIDSNNKLSVSEKATAKEELKQKEKDKIIQKQKEKSVSSEMERIKRMSGMN